MAMNDQLILESIFEKIKNYIISNDDNQLPVVNYKTPDQISSAINIAIKEKAVSEDDFLGLVDKYLEYSVRTGNKQFFNQLYSGFNFPGFIGEVFTALANTSMYTYEVAPVATIIENEMINLMNSYSGYYSGDGIFVSGGSNANLIAMFSARNQKLPESRCEGYDIQERLRAFANENAHYSFETAANILGLGSNSIIKVKADANGRMIPDELEKEINASISRNEFPFFVVATCATTLLGAYDPIDEIAAVCKSYDIWLHADGSFGGSIILSEKHRYLMKGIELTDSFAWNPHKLMNVPLICSVLLVKKRGVLQQNITDINTDYIFHDIDITEDLGKKSIQCGRKVDAVKLWFAWKYFGLEGYSERIDNLISISEYAEQIVKKQPKLELLAPRQSFTICFRYKPGYHTDLNAFNLQLRERLRKSGKTLVNYGYLNETLCIRLIIANAAIEQKDIDLFFSHLIEAGEEIEQ